MNGCCSATAIAEYAAECAVDWSKLLPQLWPFLHYREQQQPLAAFHCSSTAWDRCLSTPNTCPATGTVDVRVAAMETLENIVVHIKTTDAVSEPWLTSTVVELLEVLFHSLVSETDDAASEASLRVWTGCCEGFADSLLAQVAPRIQPWVLLLATPAGKAFDDTVVSSAFGSTFGSKGFPAVLTMNHCKDEANGARLRCCQALAVLTQRLSPDVRNDVIASLDHILASPWAFGRQVRCLQFEHVHDHQVHEATQSL